MTDFYILDGKIPVPCKEVGTWGRWMEAAGSSRVVKQEIIGKMWVSTVFLGINHSHFPGPPVLFETMVFQNVPPQRPLFDLYMNRCSTWELALEQHKQAIAWAKEQQDIE